MGLKGQQLEKLVEHFIGVGTGGGEEGAKIDNSKIQKYGNPAKGP